MKQAPLGPDEWRPCPRPSPRRLRGQCADLRTAGDQQARGERQARPSSHHFPPVRCLVGARRMGCGHAAVHGATAYVLNVLPHAPPDAFPIEA